MLKLRTNLLSSGPNSVPIRNLTNTWHKDKWLWKFNEILTLTDILPRYGKMETTQVSADEAI